MKFVDIKNDIYAAAEGLLTAFKEADKHNWEKEELIAYDNASMRIQDARGELELAEKRELERGLEKGLEKGKIEAVIGFYENGVPLSIIAKFLNITEDKVTEIIENHQRENQYN